MDSIIGGQRPRPGSPGHLPDGRFPGSDQRHAMAVGISAVMLRVYRLAEICRRVPGAES